MAIHRPPTVVPAIHNASDSGTMVVVSIGEATTDVGVPKVVAAGGRISFFQCATFVGTITYMSPKRIRNESYSYPADIWSLVLDLFECGTNEFPYTANEGPVNLMLQLFGSMEDINGKRKWRKVAYGDLEEFVENFDDVKSDRLKKICKF
ncbi:mitogen-activated protein kinase kinase 1-like [Lactuca sativa]|uniref:mitogen-activated protein kinase kinase 1-like n=1 Tax=Lactuca sativa TaxID=4236 RepID=UPI000CD81D0D|nr:mitogen-activated protein kinase kinase 1-like [Lactuca sativa]